MQKDEKNSSRILMKTIPKNRLLAKTILRKSSFNKNNSKKTIF